MSRKTAYESRHITLKASKPNDKKTKQRAWQYLFENRDKSFSATALSKVLNVHRTTVRDVLEILLEDEPITEKSKKYKVYKIGTSYRIFDEESYKKFKVKQQQGISVSGQIMMEVDNLQNPKMWKSNSAERVPSIVIFYPMTKNKNYFNTVKTSLIRLFGEYIIAILEGKKNFVDGLYIILKDQEGIDKAVDNIMELYKNVTLSKNK